MKIWRMKKKNDETGQQYLAMHRERAVINLFSLAFKVNKSRYIALIVFSGSINKRFSICCVNIYIFSIFFSIDFVRWKSLGLPHIVYIVTLNFKYFALLHRMYFGGIFRTKYK